MEVLNMKSLLGKSKSEVASAIKAECTHTHSENEQLKLLLDNLLSPSIDIDDPDIIEWLSWIVAGGSTPEEFSSTVRLYDKATTCGLVWAENFVAYRCRTCGISPCMSLCAECFHHGNHEGHDFILFRSETGGACDCGEINIIKESGCCSFHGPHGSHSLQKPSSRSRSDSNSSEQSAPAELLCIASVMMPRLFYRLILSMREEDRRRKESPVKLKPIMTCKHNVNVENNNDTSCSNLEKGHQFIKMLQGLADMGIAMRQVIFLSLTKQQAYLSEPNNQQQQQCRTFLEELIFWTIQFEFPEDLICFLLSMRSDFAYKEEFTKAFILHYRLISETILKSVDPEKLCKQHAAVSVQLFSIEQLAIKMVDQMNLLPLLVTTLYEMINYTVLNGESGKRVDCDHDIMKSSLYWPIKSDLKELLSHQKVAKKFFEDDQLLGRWFQFLSLFQGMNLTRYIEKGLPHVEQETETHIGAFTAELEISATPMWTLLSHLKDPSTADLTKRVIQHCLNNLLEWSNTAAVKRGEVSFHLPLHRTLSMFVKQGLLHQGICLSDLLPPVEHLPIIGQQLIRLQSTFYQILGRMWSRNGSEILNQAESYVNSLCCNSMIDADIYLLQNIAMSLPKNQFLSLVFQEFDIYKCFGFAEGEELEPEEQNIMLEGCLLFLATLTSSRTHLGIADEKTMALEMATLLCKGDKLHSELLELLPDRCGADSQLKNFEIVLSQVADYQAPRHMHQGKYIPKPIIWENFYDPIHTLLRSSNRSEFQVSLDGYQEFAKRSNLRNSVSENLWPPFRIPQILNQDDFGPDPRLILSSNLMLEVIFLTLYSAVHLGNVPNFTIALAVYLLELAVSLKNREEDKNQYPSSSLSLYTNSDFASNLLTNVNLNGWKDQLKLRNPIPGESIISLLIQLHNMYKESSASYTVNDAHYQSEQSRIGNGAYFISNLLNKLAFQFYPVQSFLKLETAQMDNGNEQTLENERESRKRKAQERKLQIMTELAMKRQQFMKMNEDANSELKRSPTNESSESEFECVICMEKGGSKFENPYGLITYLMPTSVLSHRKSRDSFGPLGSAKTSFRQYWKLNCQELEKYFDPSSISLSFRLHCGNGISIQTCGHYLHTDCFNSYMNSLKKSRSHLNQRDVVQVNHKKFSCPLCRQLGNSLLPIIKDALSISASEGEEVDENELTRVLRKRSTLVLSPKQKQGVEKFLDDLQKIVAFTRMERESECSNSSASSSGTTVCAQSLALVFLNALEMESLKSKSLPDLHRSYLLPLYSVLRYSYKSLPTGHSKKVSQFWEVIVGTKTVQVKGQKDVPLLFKDLNVLISHLMLQLPYGMEKKYVNVIAQKLLAVRLVQILTSLCCQLDQDDLNQAKSLIVHPISGLPLLLYKIMEFLTKCKSFELVEHTNDLSTSVMSSLLRSNADLENFVGNRMRLFVKKLNELSFLMLRHSPNQQASSSSSSLSSSSPSLDVELFPYQTPIDYNRLVSIPNFDRSLNTWLEELLQQTSSVQDVSSLHLIIWDEPKLIEIPHEYDRIFQSYRKLKCGNCNSVPSEPALCLTCGKIVCLNSFCCLDKQSKISEVIQHSLECGMGSAVYLCVLSSAILVVVGKEASVWGSIFLDSFGEEDLDLRRGKPLFLCKERFQFLQTQWKTHSFHKFELKWFAHDNML